MSVSVTNIFLIKEADEMKRLKYNETNISGTSGVVECMTHDDCAEHQGCGSKGCEDVCKKDCGLNSQCIAINHVAHCECLAGFKKTSDDKCVSSEFEIAF